MLHEAVNSHPWVRRVLRQVAKNVWQMNGKPRKLHREEFRLVRFPLPMRMTVFRLGNGNLFVHNPVEMNSELQAHLDQIGTVKWVLSVDEYSDEHMEIWEELYPNARQYWSEQMVENFESDLRRDLDGRLEGVDLTALAPLPNGRLLTADDFKLRPGQLPNESNQELLSGVPYTITKPSGATFSQTTTDDPNLIPCLVEYAEKTEIIAEADVSYQLPSESSYQSQTQGSEKNNIPSVMNFEDVFDDVSSTPIPSRPPAVHEEPSPLIFRAQDYSDLPGPEQPRIVDLDYDEIPNDPVDALGHLGNLRDRRMKELLPPRYTYDGFLIKDQITRIPEEMWDPPIVDKTGQWYDELKFVVFNRNSSAPDLIFFHPESKTLLVSKILQNYDPAEVSMTQAVILQHVMVNDMIHPHSQSPWEYMQEVEDVESAHSAMSTMLDWDFHRILLAHGKEIKEDGKHVLRSKLPWFAPRGKGDSLIFQGTPYKQLYKEAQDEWELEAEKMRLEGPTKAIAQYDEKGNLLVRPGEKLLVVGPKRRPPMDSREWGNLTPGDPNA